MLSKKIDRVLRVCAVMQDLLPEIEAEICDGDGIQEDRYARHYLFDLACRNVAEDCGVRGETVFRQMVTGFGISEDDLTDMILEHLATLRDTPEKWQNTRFVKLLYENLSKTDTLDEFVQRLEAF